MDTSYGPLPGKEFGPITFFITNKIGYSSKEIIAETLMVIIAIWQINF